MTTHGITQGQAHSDSYVWANEKYEAIVKQMSSAATQHLKHNEVERLLEQEGRELLRRLLQAHINDRSKREVKEAVIDAVGVTHTHQRQHTRHLETIFGEVEITRQGHGGIGLTSLHPLDGELNLPQERYSHTVRERVAEAASKAPFDEVIGDMDKYTGAHVPKRQAEALVQRTTQDFDPYYERKHQDPETANKVSSGGAGDQ